MHLRFAIPSATLVLFALVAAAPAHAAPSYDGCTETITALPVVITTQGTWCLKSDLATPIASGNAIEIQVNNVTIDCNGFKLGGLAAGDATAAYGVYASGRLNATVRDCKIRGFGFGVSLAGSGHVIEDNLLEGNTIIGAEVSGAGSIVRRNRIIDTGGSSIAAHQAFGVSASDGADVVDNSIIGLSASHSGGAWVRGILVTSGITTQIAGNRVSDLQVTGGTIKAIDASGAYRADIHDNFVSVWESGHTGIECYDANGIATGNRTIGFSTNAIVNCTVDDSNVSVPIP
jgi:hypothetical protein